MTGVSSVPAGALFPVSWALRTSKTGMKVPARLTRALPEVTAHPYNLSPVRRSVDPTVAGGSFRGETT